ncbi:hypothetical protein BT96DRAFT_1012327 [Gymnopus androsaceus JB14]|uniref:Thioesterase domain-containing protein n=1 Tax=Gymnopus androsaceus JB14 TaxID=1447944 RepID=A0A6A4IHE1_9AGAR|nr:hypothetical protein BT96DRAFT_1012327 [Gymnopus androsaceus JB14]
MSEQDIISHIRGNASDKIKNFLVDRRNLFIAAGLSPKLETTFGNEILASLALSEISIYPNASEPLNQEARCVCTTRVTEGFLNGRGTLHGACATLLVDFCSSLAIIALQMHNTGFPGVGVSETMHIVFHAPAALGEELRVVNTCASAGQVVQSARTEIWSNTHHRLVVSGVHTSMLPSIPKPHTRNDATSAAKL